MDLLDPAHSNLLVREDIKKGVYVEGLTEEINTSASDMEELMKRGISNRHTGSTSMNERSSRSHSVLTMSIESKTQKDGLWNIRMSRFHIIDLAGSERSKSANTAGERLKEAGMINKSLSTLGNVINSLVEVSEGRMRHIHYRDSKLTFLLRDSLGGNSKTLIIANISPSSGSFGETLSTLKFAQRAKLIKNKAIINEDSAGTVAILKEEIKRLKLLLTKQSSSEPNYQNSLQQLFTNTLEKLSKVEERENDSPEKFGSPEKSISPDAKMRVLELEKLLQKNLDYMNQFREYNTRDVEEKDQMIKKYQTTVEGFEKQRTRDKMIIKFRDSTIHRFGNLEEKLDSEESGKQLEEMKTEIELLNHQIESNPQLAKLYVENKILKKEARKNTDKSMESLYCQYTSAIEFTSSLNKYIKDYIEKEEMDRDEIIKDQVDIEKAELKAEHEEELNRLEEIIYQSNANNERLVKEIAEFDEEKKEAMDTILELKQEIESVKQKSQEEIEIMEKKFAESLDQVKEEIKEGKDNEIQEIKINLIEAQKLNKQYLKEIEKLSSQKVKSDECIEEMKKSFESFEKEKSEMIKQIDEFQIVIEEKDTILEALKELEAIKVKVEEENIILKSDNKKLEKSQTKLEKDIKVLTEELVESKNKFTQLEEENDTSIKEYDYKISELNVNIEKLETDLTECRNKLKEAESIVESHNESKEMLKLELKRASSKSETIISEYEDEKDKYKLKVSEVEKVYEEEKKKAENLEKKADNLEKEFKAIQEDKEKLQIDMQMKEEAFDTQKDELDKVKNDLESLQERYTNSMEQVNSFETEKSQLQETINDLEVKIEWLTSSEVEKKKQIDELEKESNVLRKAKTKNDEELKKLRRVKEERDEILKETQKAVKGTKESIKILRDDRDKHLEEITQLKKDIAVLEEK